MKPLIILLLVFILSLSAFRLFSDSFELVQSGRVAMSAMLLFTAIGHFAYTKGMEMMIPDFIPFKQQTVYLTGVLEILAAIGLFIPPIRVLTAWLLIAFFILILPANIYAATRHVDYQKGTLDGHGVTYLWFRIPLQLLFIIWTYFSAIKN